MVCFLKWDDLALNRYHQDTNCPSNFYTHFQCHNTSFAVIGNEQTSSTFCNSYASTFTRPQNLYKLPGNFMLFLIQFNPN